MADHSEASDKTELDDITRHHLRKGERRSSVVWFFFGYGFICGMLFMPLLMILLGVMKL